MLPDEARTEILGLDTLIRDLDAQISKSSAPQVDRRFRIAFRGFTTRWALFRTEVDSYTARLFSPFELEKRLAEWRAAFRRWQADFQKRTAIADVPIHERQAPPPTFLEDTGLDRHMDRQWNFTTGALVGAGAVIAVLAAITVAKGAA